MTWEKIRDQAKAKWKALQEGNELRIYVGTASCGLEKGAGEVLDRLASEVKRLGLKARLIEVGCLGLCSKEPLVYMSRGNLPLTCFTRVTPEAAALLLESYVAEKNCKAEYTLGHFGEGERNDLLDIYKLPFFRNQQRIALRNCGLIDPGDLEHYIARGGYHGLIRALQMEPEAVIAEIATAGLKERGWAALPVAAKWTLCRKSPLKEKMVMVNATENNAECYISRLLLESDPHAVLEGALIAAYASGAERCAIFINGRCTLAAERIQKALQQVEAAGLLDNGFPGFAHLRVKVYRGGSEMCEVEETTFLRALEAGTPIPSMRPSHPAFSELPENTVVHSVETLASVSAIMEKGADWFAAYGNPEERGTKVLSLKGVDFPGIIEVPLGTPLRKIIYEIGDGLSQGREFKLARVGGPSGGLLPEDLLDTPVGYRSLEEAGAMVGNGEILVGGLDTCVVDLVCSGASTVQAASCGRCVFCREGTVQILAILGDITRGKGKPEDLELLRELGEHMQTQSLCLLGTSAPKSLLTCLCHFEEELEAHIKKKRCPAVVCQKFVSYYISPEQCRGCGECIESCPADAIDGGEGLIHVIDPLDCEKCGNCLERCPHGAVARYSGVKPRTPPKPVPIGTWRKRD